MLCRSHNRTLDSPYPNQWAFIRKTRKLTVRDVAHFLGHLNDNHYRDIEAGRRFPRGPTLIKLIVFLKCTLEQVYPHLIWSARELFAPDDNLARAGPVQVCADSHKTKPPPRATTRRPRSRKLPPAA